jgi:hypothetical protein
MGEERRTPQEGTADTGDWAVPVGLFSPKTLCSLVTRVEGHAFYVGAP